jgi:radical SAM protein with 4Fe4S-binding SPASM domain
MQPSSKLDPKKQSGELLLRTVRNVVEAQRQREASQVDLPTVLGIKMTNRCNLRCAHCYQWNETGYHHDMTRAEQRLDLDIEVFARVLEETHPVKSRLYLWGGEPLAHREIARVLDLLAQDARETTICTNAYFVRKHLTALCRISDSLELLIALEGFEAEHDLLRGNGNFKEVIGQLDTLLKCRVDGSFRGKLSVHTMISDSMVGRLYELMEFYEQKGIDLVLLTFPWYISKETTQEMNAYVQEKFDWLIDVTKSHTWDAFKYRLSPERIEAVITDLKRINSRTWATKIRYQPDLEFDEIEAYVRGQSMSPRCATRCHALNYRVDISPTGSVSACKFFSEFSVGNLHTQPLSAMWRSQQYERIRQTLGQQLSPACSKCNVLYLHAHSTPSQFVHI